MDAIPGKPDRALPPANAPTGFVRGAREHKLRNAAYFRESHQDVTNGATHGIHPEHFEEMCDSERISALVCNA
ncbi:hypothetical protein [Paraburkholderia sp. HP33-1]|uniref:hypothetical protein n=1 Tax=Paraburkholderia sp. HP33-1 TaxID=2883243 RepID=UPI001F219957|nr:hypothetical protein [Paraburkholderia sp. HP33-1]